MPGRRIINSSYWENESIATLTIQQRLLFLGLISNADDQGRLKGNPGLVRSTIFPLDDIPLETIQSDLEAIAAIGSILLYEVDGRQCIQVTGWWKHQHLQWAWPSQVPPPSGWTDHLNYKADRYQTVQVNWETRGKKETARQPAGENHADEPVCSNVQADSSSSEASPETLREASPEATGLRIGLGIGIEQELKNNPAETEPGGTSPGCGLSAASPPDPPLSPSPPNRTPKAGGARLQPPLSPGQSALLQAFGAKRFKTDIQRQAVLELEKQHGFDRLQEGITWAAKKGIHLSTAISALETALPKWGQPKPNAAITPEQREEEAVRSRALRLNAKPVSSER